MDAKALVAWNVRRIRVAAGVSQEQLAGDAGVDRTYVGRVERELENPTVNNLEKLASALSVHISELFRQPVPGELNPEPMKGGRRPKIG